MTYGQSLNASTTVDAANAPVARYGYSLALLTTIYVFNFVDRQIVNIVAEPIKAEFGLKDWQLGSMTGLAFAILYTIAAFPIARLAESGDRARIISVAVISWSAFTALCGVATGFLTFLLARIGVGLGEAGCTPPAHSLIADIVPRAKRASALAIYSMGAPIGQLIGLVVGGFAAAQWGWRSVFFLAAAPGVILTLLAWFTLSEPRRPKSAIIETKATQPFWSTVRTLLTRRSFLLVAFGGAAASFLFFGVNAFYPSFFLRNHAVELAAEAAKLGLQPTAFLGLVLGMGGGTAGIIGAVIGGRVADAWVARDAAANVLLPAICVGSTVPLLIAAMLLQSFWVSIVLVSLCAGLFAAWNGSFFAAALGLVAPTSRATASAVVLFIINIVGLGFGPLTVGVISDGFGVSLGEAEGLRYAMVVAGLFGLISASVFCAAREALRRDTIS